MIDVFATSPHYAEHVAAVFGALPSRSRGQFLTTNAATAEHIRGLGFEPGTPNGAHTPVLVSSFGDLAVLRAKRPRIALMEHGAGQSYHPHSRHGSYAGGMGRTAGLFLHPGPDPAERDAKAYPKARVEVVGSPILDTLPRRSGEKGRTVAVTFHFNAPLCAETRSAYPYFMPALVELAKDYELLGHGHPYLWKQAGPKLAKRYEEAGIEPVRDFREVCRRADVLLFDNTSVGFAFAATGRPVVVMNAPTYDRRVKHGLRFWDAAEVGVNCDDPRRLGECIEEALADADERKAARKAALDQVYAYRTKASQRAAAALMDWAA